MQQLMIDQPIFIGFKMDGRLKQQIETLGEADRKYVSSDSSDQTTFLRICRVGEDLYVGKVVDDRLSTDRVEDIRRNVMSIVRKIGHGVNPPACLQILACSRGNVETLPGGDSRYTL